MSTPMNSEPSCILRQSTSDVFQGCPVCFPIVDRSPVWISDAGQPAVVSSIRFAVGVFNMGSAGGDGGIIVGLIFASQLPKAVVLPADADAWNFQSLHLTGFAGVPRYAFIPQILADVIWHIRCLVGSPIP